MKQRIPTDRIMKPIAEFSMAQRVGDVIQVGATAGTDAARVLDGYGPGRIDVERQARRMLENMILAIELLGGGAGDIVRIKTYVDDARDFGAWESAVAGLLPADLRPAQMTVGSWGFPLPQAVIEADLVAVTGGANRRIAAPGRPAGISLADRALMQAGDGRHFVVALPTDAEGRVVAGDAAAQAQAALASLRDALAAGGLAPCDVVMLGVTLADLRDLPAFEAAFAGFFTAPFPARSLMAGPIGLAGTRLALEAVAVPGGGRPLTGLGAIPALGAGSPGMLAGDHLYVGAQLGLDRDGRLAEGVEAQTEAAWRRVEAVVAEAGLVPEDVVMTTNLLADWRDYRAFNAGFGRFVRAPYPPRTTASLGLALPGAGVQVEAVAHRQGREARVLDVTEAGA